MSYNFEPCARQSPSPWERDLGKGLINLILGFLDICPNPSAALIPLLWHIPIFREGDSQREVRGYLHLIKYRVISSLPLTINN